MALPALIRSACDSIWSPFRAPVAKSRTGYSSGFIPPDWPVNFWQLGLDPITGYDGSAVVYACRSAYSQTTAMCPASHWISTGDGGRERITNSALSRILQQPNTYQSPSDFWLYMIDCLYGEGAAFGLALRNARFEIDSIHLMDPRQCSPRVAKTGDLFYSLAGNPIIDQLFAGSRELLQAVPARDVLHLRLPDPRNPLLGCPPVEAATIELATSNALARQALAYAANQGRPSGVLEAPPEMEIDAEGVDTLRALWDKQTKGVNVGGTPILTNGLKWSPAVVTSRDAQLAEFMQMSDQRIATAYRVPPQLLNLGTAAGPQGAAESIMAMWIATGFGFCTGLTEDAMGRLFKLKGFPDDYMEFDYSVLLRANFRDRIEGLARGVQGGIYSPNEARALEELPKAKDGDEPRVQQQVVPLSAWSQPPPKTPAPDAPPSAPPADPAADPAADPSQQAAAANDRAIRSYRASRDRFAA
jgi:HK97 family phage portal protein